MRTYIVAIPHRLPPTDPVPTNVPPLVLVVDDEPLVLQLVSRMLDAAGFRVVTAATAIDALDLLGTLHPGPNLVLTDVRMDPVDGASLARLVRHARPGLPVLFMSGYAPDLEALPGPFLPKPFTTEQLVGAVRDLTSTPHRRGVFLDSR